MRSLLLAALALAACTVDVDHTLTLGDDLRCLECFPACMPGTHATHCVTADGAPCGECTVTCLGGKELLCADGPTGTEPFCYNDAGGQQITVPVVCAPR